MNISNGANKTLFLIVLFLAITMGQIVLADDHKLIPTFPLEESRESFDFSLDLFYGKGHSSRLTDLITQKPYDIGDGSSALTPAYMGMAGISNSAAEGYPDAQILLGFLYLSGSYLDKNARLAAVWFEMAKVTQEEPLYGQSQLNDLLEKAFLAEMRIKKGMNIDELVMINNINIRCMRSDFVDCSE